MVRFHPIKLQECGPLTLLVLHPYATMSQEPFEARAYRRPFLQLLQQRPRAQIHIIIRADEVPQVREMEVCPMQHRHCLQRVQKKDFGHPTHYQKMI